MAQRHRISDDNGFLLNLWQQAQAGNNAAFCQLAERLYSPLFNYACTFTPDRELIKDAIQDLMLHIWEKKKTIHIQFVAIYFFKALRNQLLLEFRRNTPSDSFSDADSLTQLSDYHTAETDIVQNESVSEQQLWVGNAINVLPKRQREVIFLKFFEGLTNEQIAGLMQLNRQSVANLVVKALSSLKAQIPVLDFLLVAAFCWFFAD